MEIMQPPKKKGPVDGPQVEGRKVLTVMLDEKGKVYYYFGLANPRKPPLPELLQTDFSKDGIRKVLLKRNIALYKRIDSLNSGITKGTIKIPHDSIKTEIKKLKSAEAKSVGNIVLVKATDKAKYGDFVNIMDELSITNIPTYSITEMSAVEQQMLDDYKKTHPGL
jgi:hypothetical protein